MVDRQNIGAGERDYGYSGGRDYGDLRRDGAADARSRLYDTRPESEASPYQRIAERYSRSEPSLYEREPEREYGRESREYPQRDYAERREAPVRERERERDYRDYEERTAPALRYIEREERPERAPERAPAARSDRRGAEELMPSIHTMRYLDRQDKEKAGREKETAKPAGKLDTRAKVMIALYAAIALALVITIIVTGVSVANMGNGVAALERGVSAQQVRLSDQATGLNDYSGVADWAADKNMKEDDGSGAKRLTLKPLAETGSAPRVNPFDSFCDWLNRLFGG